MMTKVPNGKHYGDQEDQLSMTPWKETQAQKPTSFSQGHT